MAGRFGFSTKQVSPSRVRESNGKLRAAELNRIESTLAAMDRIVLVAHLKPGSSERARELLAEHSAREDLKEAFDRHAIFLSETRGCVLVRGSGRGPVGQSDLQRPERERNRSLDSALRRTVALGTAGVFLGTRGCEDAASLSQPCAELPSADSAQSGHSRWTGPLGDFVRHVATRRVRRSSQTGR